MNLIRGLNPNLVKNSEKNRVFTGEKSFEIPLAGSRYYTFMAWVKDEGGESSLSLEWFRRGEVVGDIIRIAISPVSHWKKAEINRRAPFEVDLARVTYSSSSGKGQIGNAQFREDTIQDPTSKITLKPVLGSKLKRQKPYKPLNSEEEKLAERFSCLKVWWWNGPSPEDKHACKVEAIKTLSFRCLLEFGVSFQGGRPNSFRELKDCDIVVLDNTPVTSFNGESFNWLKRFYREGGAIVMIGGHNSFSGAVDSGMPEDMAKGRRGYHGTPLADILPVKLSSSSIFYLTESTMRHSYTGAVTPEGKVGTSFKAIKRKHPIMKNIPWEKAPSILLHSLVIPKSGVDVLAVDTIHNDPLIVLGDRVLACMVPDSGGSYDLGPRQEFTRSNWQPWRRFLIHSFNYLTRDIDVNVNERRKFVRKPFFVGKEVRKNYPKPPDSFVPVKERDFVYVHSYLCLLDDYPYEEEFFVLGRGPVNMYHLYCAWDTPKEFYRELKSRRIPLHAGTLSSWVWLVGGLNEGERELVFRARYVKDIEAIQELCGECFDSAVLAEVEGIASMAVVTGEKDRIRKATLFTKILKELIEGFHFPPELFLVCDNGALMNPALSYEAGFDCLLQEVLFLFANVQLLTSGLRGCAKSFGKRWGTDTSRYSMPQPDGSPTAWKLTEVYKAFIQPYYAGSNWHTPQSEIPVMDGGLTECAQTVLKYLHFVKDNPRCKEVVCRTAVVRSKGDYWSGVSHCERMISLAGLVVDKERGIDHRTDKEFVDYRYFNAFFTDFSEDAHLVKRLWSGTPYGTVDIVYPAMKPKDMQTYDTITFLGFHRMDSVRKDFIDDLITYVKKGGTVLLSVDQLRNSNNKLSGAGKVRELAGADVSDGRIELRDYVEVINSADDFNFPKKRYGFRDKALPWGGKPSVHRTKLKGAEVIAEDGSGTPVLLMNSVGKGKVFLVLSSTISEIPPAGKSKFIYDIMDRIVKRPGLPVRTTPRNKDIECILSRTEDKEAVIFLMNHGEKPWRGSVVIDLEKSGLSKDLGGEVQAKVCKGYKEESYSPDITKRDNELFVESHLYGKDKSFDPYYTASFAVIRIKG